MNKTTFQSTQRENIILKDNLVSLLPNCPKKAAKCCPRNPSFIFSHRKLVPTYDKVLNQLRGNPRNAQGFNQNRPQSSYLSTMDKEVLNVLFIIPTKAASISKGQTSSFQLVQSHYLASPSFSHKKKNLLLRELASSKPVFLGKRQPLYLLPAYPY